MTTDMTQSDNVEELFFGDLQARSYQIGSLKQVEQAFTNGAKRVCLVSPTGSGKTVNAGIIMTSPIIRKLCGVSNETTASGNYKQNLRVMFIAHRDRLLQQAVSTYANIFGVELIIQSCFSDIPAHILEEGWDFTILDESHHESMTTIQYQLENITSSTNHPLGFIPLLGLTATPDRADGLVIKFDTIITAITREQAVEQGFLAKTYIHSFVDATSRDNKVDILSDIFKDYHQIMGRGIVFVSTKAEARELSARIVEHTGKMVACVVDVNDATLNTILDDFSKGEWDFIVNCAKLGEGIDIRGCDTVVIGRTVGSYPLLNQYIGRGARPDSDCNVIELVNPLTDNLDTTVVVGIPENHTLYYKRKGKWVEREFDYTTVMNTSLDAKVIF